MLRGDYDEEYTLNEVTLRKYERPSVIKDDRELVKKMCLSIGLLQPGDGRDVIVDIFYVLLKAKQNYNFLSSEQIRDKVIIARSENKLNIRGTAASNIRRQIKRLRDVCIIDKVRNVYRVAEFDKIQNLFSDKMKKYIIPSIIQRVEEYCREVDNRFV